ncbi:MAG: extracellular solute-binding protein [Armatimonadetes bacterium]|nr:extracellular solute-binding protein [Armatimonadota bacterium]
MMRIILILSFAPVITGAVLLCSCRRVGERAADSALTLVIVSPHWDGIQREFTLAFQEHYKRRFKKHVEIRFPDVGGTSQCLRYIRTSFKESPSGIGADMFWGGGIDPHIELKRDGLLSQYKPPEEILKRIPKHIAGMPLYDEDYYWFGTALSGFGILFNKVVLNEHRLPEPKEWADLSDPKFYGWIELTDPRQSGVAHMMFEIILQAYGWKKGFEVIAMMSGNARVYNRGSQEPVESVANGQAACAPTIDFYAWSKIAEVGSKILGFVYPKDMTVINPDGIAILRGAPNRDVAEEFVNFVLSKSGQMLWMLPRGARGGPREFTLARMSILPDLYEELRTKSIVDVNPFEWKTSMHYDAKLGADRWEFINSLIGAFFVDAHKQVQEAFSALIEAGMPKELLKEFAQVPVDEAQAMKLAKRWVKEKLLSSRYEAEWASLAQARYKRIVQLARKVRGQRAKGK